MRSMVGMDSTRIYLDNSATSFPKPPAVTEAMVRFAEDCGASAGRGAYTEARACEELLAQCRARVAELIHAENPQRIVFAMNCSEALNTAIRGILNTAPRDSHARLVMSAGDSPSPGAISRQSVGPLNPNTMHETPTSEPGLAAA